MDMRHPAFWASSEEAKTTIPARPRRRLGGRSAHVRTAVFEAALQVLQERGYASTSIAEIAKQSGVHETSIYRRWNTKDALLVEALLVRTQEAIPMPDTGRLRTDLIQLLQQFSLFFQAPLGKAFLQILASAEYTPAMTAARQSYWNKRFALIKGIFERAVQRGELVASLDPQLLTELLVGPFYVRLFLTDRPFHTQLPEQIVDLVLRGIEHLEKDPERTESKE